MTKSKKFVRVVKVEDLTSHDFGKYYLLIDQKKVSSAWSLVLIVSYALLLYYEDNLDSYRFEDRLFELMSEASTSIICHNCSSSVPY